MILPITVYGHPVLRKRAKEIGPDYEGLQTLIDNMWETMYKAEGVGLAAPQVNKSIRVLIIDATPFGEDEPDLANFKKVFINPEILEFNDEEENFNEGCLSIPNIREDVSRPTQVRIKYMNEKFEEFEETYDGVKARIFQHEFDHLEGRLFTDKVSPLRRRLLKGKLTAIAKNKTIPAYRVVPNR